MLYTTAYFTLQSNSSGYGNIECKGNETKLEECDVRKNIHLTCKVAVVCHCSTSKLKINLLYRMYTYATVKHIM